MNMEKEFGLTCEEEGQVDRRMKKTEAEWRAENPEWPKTPGALMDYIIDKCQAGGDDYGTAVYAISLSAVAAFHFASHLVGASGFQASCADLDIIRRTRHMDGPFALIKASDMLYPQYDVVKNVKEYLNEWESWAASEAKKLIASETMAAPSVLKHWEKLAAMCPAEPGKKE